MDKFIIKSDSQLVTNSIKGLIKVPSKIINNVLPIVNFANILLIFSSVIVISPRIPSRIRLQTELIVLVKLSIHNNELSLLKEKYR